jgi:hypothetical protein
MYQYAFGAKSLQLLVSLRFFNPRDDAYCIIWVKGIDGFWANSYGLVPTINTRYPSVCVLLSRAWLAGLASP